MRKRQPKPWLSMISFHVKLHYRCILRMEGDHDTYYIFQYIGSREVLVAEITLKISALTLFNTTYC